MAEDSVRSHRGRFHFMVPASKHNAGVFCCLVPVCVAFLALAKFLSSLAWANNYEDYSFLLDHLSVISRFLSDFALTLAIFAGLRLALDFGYRKLSAMTAVYSQEKEHQKKENEEADNLLRRRAAGFAKFCAFTVYALNFTYSVTLALLLLLFTRLNWTHYSPFLFYRHYRNEPFQYPLSMFLIVAGLAVHALILAGLFKKQRRLKAVPCAPALRSMFQAFWGMSLCAAAAIAFKRWGNADLTLAAEWGITGGCVYFVAGLLRGAGRDMLRGDMTGAFSYEPLFSLPEQMKLFDKNISWEERTGLSFKSLWCVNRALQLIPWMTLAGCGMLLLFTSLYVVESHQEALLYRLGTLRQTHSIKSPGLYFKLPWPVDRVDIYDVSRVRNMQIGYIPSSSRDYLWNSAHGGVEYTLLSGGGNEMIAVNLRVSYKIRDLYGYATRCANPEDLLSSKVYEMMMQKTMSSDLNTMLSVDRKGLSEALTEELSEYASTLGLHVNEVIIESIHPPIDLADVYHGVVGASIQKETLIARAEADAEKTRNIALQEKERAILAAAARQIERTSLARRDMAVYEYAFLASAISPECYKLRKRTDTYRQVIQGGHVYVFSPDTTKDAYRYLITNGLGSNGLSPILMKQEF